MKIVSHDASRDNMRCVDATITHVVEFSTTGSKLDSRYDEVNGSRERAHAKASRVASLRREVKRDRCKGSEVRQSCARIYTVRHCSRLARNCRRALTRYPTAPFKQRIWRRYHPFLPPPHRHPMTLHPRHFRPFDAHPLFQLIPDLDRANRDPLPLTSPATQPLLAHLSACLFYQTAHSHFTNCPYFLFFISMILMEFRLMSCYMFLFLASGESWKGKIGICLLSADKKWEPWNRLESILHKGYHNWMINSKVFQM